MTIYSELPACATKEPVSTMSICKPDEISHNHGSNAFQNVEKFAAQFEDPSRDEWQKPDTILEFIGLSEHDKFADIGAGTGYFSVRAARLLKTGIVYAVDSQPEMLEYIEKRASVLGLNNIKVCRCANDQISLPGLANVILMVNTYHHIHDRKRYFADLRRWLAPDGKLVIVEGKSGTPMEPPKELRVTASEITSELKGAGYSLTAESADLPYQSMQMFQ